MGVEEIPKIEQHGKNRAELLALEKTGKYVFHGSTENLNILEPRQAQNKNKRTEKMEYCGSPAIYATPYADVAIFAALIKNNAKNVKEDNECEMDLENLHFSATQNLLDDAKKIVGKVYILDKSKFQLVGAEFSSDKEVVPIAIMKVTADDLPENIKLIE
jgi:hypothetical protein